MADALRWRAVGRCASQQLTEQNISLMRPELQVDTEQRQYFDPRLMGLRHIEQTARDAMAGKHNTARLSALRPTYPTTLRESPQWLLVNKCKKM
jgi:hypothetical protein